MNEPHEAVESPSYSLLDAALWYAAHGWQVFPCHTPTPGGCSCRRAACPDIGKHPRTQHGLKDATTSASIIRRWWEMWPDANIGIATGPVSNLVVLDEDTYKGGDIHTLEQAYTSLPETVEQHTGGGGRQFFYTHPGARIKNSVEDLGTGLDIRGDGGYVIVPPSLHRSGKRYQWEIIHDPADTALARLPEWLQALCSESSERPTRATKPLEADTPIPEGQRNDHLFRLGCSMRARGFAEAAIFGALAAINDTQCQPPLSATEVRRIAASCATYEITQPVNGAALTSQAPAPRITTPYGDVFYAEWFVALHGTEWRYCHPWKSWLHWVGTHWERDTQGAAMDAARQTMRHVGQHAMETDNKELLKHYSRNLNHQPLTRLLAQASTMPGVAIDPTLLDQHPYLLNCRNGTVDLRTGQKLPHVQTQYLTRCLRVDYLPDAVAPHWEQFLWRIMGGTVLPDSPDDSSNVLDDRTKADERATRLITFLQRMVGYTLTGSTQEQCFFLLYGPTKTGKSTFTNLIKTLLGPYGTQAEMSTFLHKDKPEVRNDLADLAGMRLVCAIETDEGKRLAEALIKQLTGGTDSIKARFLFQEYFEYRPQFKVFLATNYRPRMNAADDALWERVKLVPFDVHIPLKERDKHLDDTLLGELPGILAWAIRGCLAWQQDDRLQEPPEVRSATSGYREEMDTISHFLDECCVQGDKSYVKVKAGVLVGAYLAWCKQMGNVPLSNRTFIASMEAKEYTRVRGTANQYYWHGVALATTSDEQDD